MSKEGAIAGMLVGVSLMLYYILKFKFGVFDGGKASVPGLQDEWWFGVSPEGFGSVAMVFHFVVALIINKFTPPPPKKVQDIVENIRIPVGASPPNIH